MIIDLTKGEIEFFFYTIKKRKEDIDLTLFEYKNRYSDGSIPHDIKRNTANMRIEYYELEKLKEKIKNNHPEVLI